MTPIERIAWAIAPDAWTALAFGGAADSLGHRHRRAASLRHARAALEAMREPTPRMIKAAEALWDFDGPYHSNASAEEVWPAMIDAALKEGA